MNNNIFIITQNYLMVVLLIAVSGTKLNLKIATFALNSWIKLAAYTFFSTFNSLPVVTPCNGIRYSEYPSLFIFHIKRTAAVSKKKWQNTFMLKTLGIAQHITWRAFNVFAPIWFLFSFPKSNVQTKRNINRAEYITECFFLCAKRTAEASHLVCAHRHTTHILRHKRYSLFCAFSLQCRFCCFFFSSNERLVRIFLYVGNEKTIKDDDGMTTY